MSKEEQAIWDRFSERQATALMDAIRAINAADKARAEANRQLAVALKQVSMQDFGRCVGRAYQTIYEISTGVHQLGKPLAAKICGDCN